MKVHILAVVLVPDQSLGRDGIQQVLHSEGDFPAIFTFSRQMPRSLKGHQRVCGHCNRIMTLLLVPPLP